MTGTGVAFTTGTAHGVVLPTSCANCGAVICGCADPLYSGVVTIDRTSEPGALARHIRDTACMRDQGPALPNPSVPA